MSRRKVKLEVFGKINLSLNVTGAAGGYHLLDMIMASVNIADAITVCSRTDGRLNVEYSGSFSPGQNDSVTRAVNALSAHAGVMGADVYVEKRLPVSGGMGGSSADAAGVIVALDKIYGLSLMGVKTHEAALKAGSDVPYMLTGGYARVTGRGETVRPLDCGGQFNVCIADCGRGVNTGLCFKRFDALFPSGVSCPADNDFMKRALERGEHKEAFLRAGNALTAAACTLEPEVKRTLEALRKTGARYVSMSGSGSACYGVYDEQREAEEAEKMLMALGFNAIAARTLNSGIKIIEES